MTDRVVVEEIQIIAEQADASVLLHEVQDVRVVAVAEQGPPGPRGLPGPAGATTLIETAQAISGHRVVACDADGRLVPADCTIAGHLGAVVGLVEHAYGAGVGAEVKNEFVIEHAGWSWAPGPVLLGADGLPTQALPVGAVFSQTVGTALAPTRLLIDLQPPIFIS